MFSCFVKIFSICLFFFVGFDVAFSVEGANIKSTASKQSGVQNKSIRNKKTNLTKSERTKKNIVRKVAKKKKGNDNIRIKDDGVVADVRIVKKTIFVNSPLCTYAEKNDITSMRKSLLKVNYDQDTINTICSNGDSLVLRATKSNNYLVVKFLVDNGADVNIQNIAGVSPLHIASRVDTKEMDRILEVLLHEKSIDINQKDAEGYTPLMRAVEFEKISVIEKLLKKGADKTIKNNYGRSAIDIANSVLSGKKTEEEKAVSNYIVKLLDKND